MREIKEKQGNESVASTTGAGGNEASEQEQKTPKELAEEEERRQLRIDRRKKEILGNLVFVGELFKLKAFGPQPVWFCTFTISVHVT